MRTTSLLIIFGLAAACSGSSDGLKLFPDTMLYSGVVSGGGGASFKVTISASGASGIAWSSADATIASVTGTDTLGTVTALKAGATTIKALAGGSTISLPLTVTTYTAADITAGTTAYNTTYTCARAGCHDAAGPDVGPADIGKHTDAQVLAALVSGTNPEGGPISIGAAMHTFTIAAGSAESRGIIGYMRSLPPGIPKNDN